MFLLAVGASSISRRRQLCFRRTRYEVVWGHYRTDCAKAYKKQNQNKNVEKHLARERVHQKGTVELTDVVQMAKASEGFFRAGAIGLFIGVVRGETKSKEIVKKLELEAYENEANRILENICDDLRQVEGIVDVQVHHLVGEFEASEELVYVLVAGAHRSVVFPVLREAVERYKEEVPIFKKEYIVNKKGEESYWVGERETE
jgi:molybdopterin synthase catalytic subunit